LKFELHWGRLSITRIVEMGHELYVLHLSFKVDIEYVKREFDRIGKFIRVWAKPVLHGSKCAGFVNETEETLEQLSDRIRAVLDDIDLLDNYWVIPAPSIIKAKNGGADPFQSRLAEGWHRVRQRPYGENVTKREGW
jgi:hypothetical protein